VAVVRRNPVLIKARLDARPTDRPSIGPVRLCPRVPSASHASSSRSVSLTPSFSRPAAHRRSLVPHCPSSIFPQPRAADAAGRTKEKIKKTRSRLLRSIVRGRSRPRARNGTWRRRRRPPCVCVHVCARARAPRCVSRTRDAAPAEIKSLARRFVYRYIPRVFRLPSTRTLNGGLARQASYVRRSIRNE